MKPILENNFSDPKNNDIIWWGEEVNLETRVAIM